MWALSLAGIGGKEPPYGQRRHQKRPIPVAPPTCFGVTSAGLGGRTSAAVGCFRPLLGRRHAALERETRRRERRFYDRRTRASLGS